MIIGAFNYVPKKIPDTTNKLKPVNDCCNNTSFYDLNKVEERRQRLLSLSSEDNSNKIKEEKEKDLIDEIESLTIKPDNGKESGGKRKTKRKNKKSKKSSRKKRKTSKKKHLYKKRIQRGSGSTFSRRRVYNHDFFKNRYMPGERLTIKTDDNESHYGKITNINKNNLVIEESDGISSIPYDQIINIELDMYKK